MADVEDGFGLIILQDSTFGVSGITGLCASALTLLWAVQGVKTRASRCEDGPLLLNDIAG